MKGWIAFLCVILACELEGKAQGYTGGFPYGMKFDAAQNVIWVDEGGLTESVVQSAGATDWLYLQPGSHTVTTTLNWSTSKNFYLESGAWITGTDTLFSITGGTTTFAGQGGIRSNGAGSAIVTTNHAKIVLDGITLDLNQQTFADSVEASGCTLGDSITFTGYADLLQCKQDDDWWCFNTGAEAYLTKCSGFNFTKDNLKQLGSSQLTLFGCDFYTHGNYNSYAGDGDENTARFTAVSSSFSNRGGTKFAWDGQDTLKVKLQNCQFNNLIVPFNAYAFRLRGADTLWVGGCQSSGQVVLDTMTVSSDAELYVVMTGDNNFANEVYFGGAANQGAYLASRITGTSKDHYVMRELVTLSKSLSGCIYDDGSTDVFIHLMDSTGVHSGYLTTEGQLLLEGGNQFISIGDTTGGAKRVKYSWIHSFADAFSGTSVADTVLIKGVKATDYVLITPQFITSPQSGDQFYGAVCRVDTVLVRRGASATSGGAYFGTIFRYVGNP